VKLLTIPLSLCYFQVLNKRFSENLIISKRIILVGSYRDSSYIFDYWLNYSKPTISIRADDVVIKNLKVGTRDSKEYTFRIDSSRGTIIQSVTMYADPTMYPGTHILLINSSYDVDIKDVYIEGEKDELAVGLQVRVLLAACSDCSVAVC
jgi:hypothetical protein